MSYSPHFSTNPKSLRILHVRTRLDYCKGVMCPRQNWLYCPQTGGRSHRHNRPTADQAETCYEGVQPFEQLKGNGVGTHKQGTPRIESEYGRNTPTWALTFLLHEPGSNTPYTQPRSPLIRILYNPYILVIKCPLTIYSYRTLGVAPSGPTSESLHNLQLEPGSKCALVAGFFRGNAGGPPQYQLSTSATQNFQKVLNQGMYTILGH